MEFDFLKPLASETLDFIKNLTPQQLGSKISFHTKNDFPDVDKVKIAIIGVLENRGANTQNETVNLENIRKELYGLFPGNWNAPMADLGNILMGNSINDTYFLLQKLVATLLKKKIIPIVIGGSQDLTYPLYRAYDNLEQMVNLVSVDNKFDFGKENESINADSYLSKIIIEEPNNLFNFSNLGYQTYFNSQEEIDLIEKLFFDAFRIGDLSSNISIAEPVFRDADIVSIDLTAVKSCDSGNIITFNPNGFNGKEICALSRYAGISDKVSLLGIFNHNNTKSEAVLIAQIIWYFIEGIHYRSNEYPFGNKTSYLKYTVPIDDVQLIFYKSDVTGRWWIEIPLTSQANNKLQRNTLLPCCYDDYLAACNQEIPDRWLKTQRKCMA